MKTLHRASIALGAAALAATLSACSLHATMDVAADGRTQLTMTAFVDQSYVEGQDIQCAKLLQGIVGDHVPIDAAAVTQDAQPDGLHCDLTQDLQLNDLGWDGSTRTPLWKAEPEIGRYELSLPLSDDTGSGDLTISDFREAGVDADVSLAVTMPEQVISTTVGKAEGNTVTLTGMADLVHDLDVVADKRGKPMSRAWIIVGGVALASAALGGLAWVLHRRSAGSR